MSEGDGEGPWRSATVSELGAALTALRRGRDELVKELRTVNDASRSTAVTLEQTRDQASVTNAKLTQRIQGQAEDIRSLQEGRVLDRAEWSRERAALEQEMERLKGVAERFEDDAIKAAEKSDDKFKRARDELRDAQQANTRLQAALAQYRSGDGSTGKQSVAAGEKDDEGDDAKSGGDAAASRTKAPGWRDIQELEAIRELKSELESEKTRVEQAESRAGAAEAALAAANARQGLALEIPNTKCTDAPNTVCTEHCLHYLR